MADVEDKSRPNRARARTKKLINLEEKSWDYRQSAPPEGLHPTGGKGDIEKLVRAVHDALTDAGVWRDDAQVVRLNAAKVWCHKGERPAATIVAREVGP